MSFSLKTILIILLFISGNSVAQTFQPYFRNFSVDEGLPSSETYGVFQDKKGYIWIAGDLGVSRFNGTEFINYSVKEGLPENTILKMFEDKKGRIWFVSVSAKLSYFYNDSIYPYKFNNKLNSYFETGNCNSFLVDEKDNVYLAINENGYFIIDSAGYVKHLLPDAGAVYSIIEPLPSLPFIISTSEFITKPKAKLNIRTKSIKHTTPVKGEFFRSAIIAKNKTLIGGNQNVIVMWDTSGNYNFLPIAAPKEEILFIYEDINGKTLCGMRKNGVLVFENQDFSKSLQHMLSNLSVSGILRDKEGGIWCSTLENGIFYSPSADVKVFMEKVGSNKFVSIVKADSAIYAGTIEGSIYKIDPKEFFIINKWETNSGTLHNLYWDEYNYKLFFSGNVKTGFIANNIVVETPFIHGFKTLVTLDKSTLMSGTNVHLTKIKNKNLENINKEAFKFRVDKIYINKEKRIWVGTNLGLFEYKEAGEKLTWLGNKAPVFQYRILDISEMENYLVLATKGFGIILYDGNRSHVINSSVGLTNDNVKSLEIHGNTIWAATNSGINKISVISRDSLKYTIDHYSVNNSLPSNEINDLSYDKDQLWIASNKGLAVMNANATNEPYKLPVYITSVSVNGIHLKKLTEYKVESSDDILINYEGVSFQRPEKIIYKYRLSNSDTTWKYTTNRNLSFTSMPHGYHTFELTGRLPNSEWAEITRINFFVPTPFWRTVWFIALTIFLVIVLILLWFRMRFQKIRKKEKEKNEFARKISEMELKALRAQINPHFIFNCLNSINYLILENEKEKAQKYLANFGKLMRMILNHSNKTLVSIFEELEILKLYVSMENLRTGGKINYVVDTNGIDIYNLKIPPMMLQPVIENSIWHGVVPKKQPGKIILTFEQKENSIICTVEDDGIGRKETGYNINNTENPSGMKLVEGRQRVIWNDEPDHGAIKITDLKSKTGIAAGTKVEIKFPIIF